MKTLKQESSIWKCSNKSVGIQDHNDYTCSFTLSKTAWNKLKKAVEKEFSGEYWDYSEVRVYIEPDDDEINIEGHCCLDRRRKKR
jgi:hypothetical protein